jgi:predicted membrane protein
MAKYNLFSIDNIIGVLLAVLIIFDLQIEKPIINTIKTPIGMIFTVIFAIILFVCLNPIIGILFLIYLFMNFKDSINPTKNTILSQLNPPKEVQVEEEIIFMNAPIKNQNKGNNVSFQPIIDTFVP